MIWNAYSEEKLQLNGVSIKSCGHIFAKQGRSICRPNGRDDWLLFYVYKGSESFLLKKKEIATEGSFIIFRPGEPQLHTCEENGSSEFYFLHFSAEDDSLLFGLESSKIYKSTKIAKIAELFEQILTELQLKRTEYERLCIGRLTELLILLKRECAEGSEDGKEEYSKIAYVVQYIHKNYSSNESLDDYAAICSLSKFHFLRRFADITGSTPVAYRNRLRLEHAREMLDEQSSQISEISDAVGYSSPSYFCEAFKKEFGISPMEYKRRLKA